MMLIGRGQSKQHKLATPASALILNLPINIVGVTGIEPAFSHFQSEALTLEDSPIFVDFRI